MQKALVGVSQMHRYVCLQAHVSMSSPEEDFSCPVLSLSTLFSGDGSLCPRAGLAASELSDPPFSAPDNYPEVTGTRAATSSFS